jgi:hypothetical protein
VKGPLQTTRRSRTRCRMRLTVEEIAAIVTDFVTKNSDKK